VDLRLLGRAKKPVKRTEQESSSLFDSQSGQVEQEQALDDDHRQLYDLLDRRIRRHAELAKRETGVHALWFGYPLLYLKTGEGDAEQWILAPVFLWPIQIQPDLRYEGRLRFRRDRESGMAQFNRAMANWVRRQLQLELPLPSQEELLELGWNELGLHLRAIAEQFSTPPTVEYGTTFQGIPSPKQLEAEISPRLFNSAVLGYVRWQNEAILADLEAIKDEAQPQGVVGGFLTGAKPAPEASKHEPPAEEDRYLVRQADFSQQAVIWQARRGPGLVVHGPPGTGKSETIVNIIADALAHEKKVLMVCQKQAATNVVLKRLVGLEKLCIEVHDPESDRRKVFDEIREQVEKIPHVAPAAAQPHRSQLAQRITVLEAELDRFAKALHEKHARFGISYRHMKAREGTCYTTFPTVRVLPALQRALENVPAQELDEICPKVEMLGRLFREADPFHNPWRLRQATVQMTVALRSDVLAITDQLRTLDIRHQDVVKQHGEGMPLPANLAEFQTDASEIIDRLRKLATNPNSSKARVTKSWLRAIRGRGTDQLETHYRRCQETLDLAKQVQKCSRPPAALEPLLRQDSVDGGRLRRATNTFLGYRERGWRTVNPWFWLSRRTVRTAISQVQTIAQESELWSVAEDLQEALNTIYLRTELARANQSLIPHSKLRPMDDESQLSFPQLALRGMEIAAELCRWEQRHPWFTQLLNAFLSDKQAASLPGMVDEVDRAFKRAHFARDLLDVLAGLESFLLPEALDEPRRSVAQGKWLKPWLDALVRGLDGLQALTALDLNRVQREGAMRKIVDALEIYETRLASGEKLPTPVHEPSASQYGKWWVALVRYTATRLWQELCEREHPELVELTPEIHASKVKELSGLLAQKKALEVDAIQARWLARQVAHRREPWKQMFQLRRGAQGDAKRLREAVELSLDHGLLDMRPCWLANPAAVCQIFPRRPELFDVVIFDEASQCPIEQAIPVICRGRILVVSGDEKQLPPTSFFSPKVADDQVQENEESQSATDRLVQLKGRRDKIGEEFMLEVEDLLEAAVSLLPEERYLSVHYRSEHPALINFSNHAFYGGRLEAPPSRLGLLSDYRPIQCYQVAGLYERRTNHSEATKVVEILKEVWLSEGDCPTVGVVTFNQPQREEIEDLIQQECHENAAFEARYEQEVTRKDANQDVGFFVKNLENVQGDERDMMIFSTTFGKNPEGRFYRLFGPVGAEGGERRLNVAVTRAKRRVLIVGSMPIAEISTALNSDLAPGSGFTPAGYLQLYLAYAKAISAGDSNAARLVLERLGKQSKSVTPVGRGPDSPFEEEVMRIIERLGHQVHCQVGDGGFRIDLAVLHPEPNRGYVLGIECDGATYHSDRSARTRDVWRQEILTRYGWRFHRIWSTRWWNSRHEEVQKLKAAIDAAVLGGPQA
jgi:primosomal replication protein N''